MATPAQIKAQIKRAAKQARDQHSRTDAFYLARITEIYRQAGEDIQALIRSQADTLGIVRLQQLQGLKLQIEQRLRDLSAQRDQALTTGMTQAAKEGGAVFSPVIFADPQQLANETVRQITLFVDAEGLQLSDRLWNIDSGAADEVIQVINRAIVQGNSASEATADFLRRGEPVPANLHGKERQAAADVIARQAVDPLTKSPDSARAKVQRVMRTELNRAHGEGYMAAAFELSDVVATRFLLSPRHPRPDICDMHASVNRYGLGPGVYPRDRNPWPAHPNTISFVEVVFADEISADDRAGKTDRIDWLRGQDGPTQAAVLGGVQKRAAFLAGHVGERSIATRWKTLKKRLTRQGVDVTQFAP